MFAWWVILLMALLACLLAGLGAVFTYFHRERTEAPPRRSR